MNLFLCQVEKTTTTRNWVTRPLFKQLEVQPVVQGIEGKSFVIGDFFTAMCPDRSGCTCNEVLYIIFYCSYALQRYGLLTNKRNVLDGH